MLRGAAGGAPSVSPGSDRDFRRGQVVPGPAEPSGESAPSLREGVAEGRVGPPQEPRALRGNLRRRGCRERPVVIVEPVLAHLRDLDPGPGRAWPAGDGDRLPGGGSLSGAAEASERAGPLGPDPFVGDGCGDGCDAPRPGAGTRRRHVPARVGLLQAGQRGVVAPLPRVATSRRRAGSAYSRSRWTSNRPSDRTSSALCATTGASGAALPPRMKARYRSGISAPPTSPSRRTPSRCRSTVASRASPRRCRKRRRTWGSRSSIPAWAGAARRSIR